MDNEEKSKRINIKISIELHKAIQYAKIERGITVEKMVVNVLKEHLIKLGFLKITGESIKLETTEIEE